VVGTRKKGNAEESMCTHNNPFFQGKKSSNFIKVNKITTTNIEEYSRLPHEAKYKKT
jgi:hypothetical protein